MSSTYYINKNVRQRVKTYYWDNRLSDVLFKKSTFHRYMKDNLSFL